MIACLCMLVGLKSLLLDGFQCPASAPRHVMCQVWNLAFYWAWDGFSAIIIVVLFITAILHDIQQCCMKPMPARMAPSGTLATIATSSSANAPSTPSQYCMSSRIADMTVAELFTCRWILFTALLQFVLWQLPLPTDIHQQGHRLHQQALVHQIPTIYLGRCCIDRIRVFDFKGKQWILYYILSKMWNWIAFLNNSSVVLVWSYLVVELPDQQVFVGGWSLPRCPRTCRAGRVSM